MEAPYRFPIHGLDDVERLLEALAAAPELVPGSLRLAEEEAGLLAEELAAEGREGDLALLRCAHVPVGLAALVRALWVRPLARQRPRALRLEAELAGEPGGRISLRLRVPVRGAVPRWVGLDGSRDAGERARLLAVYRALGQASGLTLQEV